MEKLLGFLGIPSPSILVAFLLAIAAAGGWGVFVGRDIGRNEVKADQADAQKPVIDALGAQLTAAYERSLASEAARAAAAAQAAAFKADFDSAARELRNAKNKPAPSCVPDDWRVRVNAVVRAVNRPVAPRDTGIMPITLPAGTGTGLGFGPVGGRLVGDGAGVLPVPRDVQGRTGEGNQ